MILIATTHFRIAVGVASMLLLMACGGSGGSGDGDPDSGTGTLSAAITDSAVEGLSAVNLRVIALQLRQQDAEEEDFIEIELTDEMGMALEFNLLEYQMGETFPLFDSEEVPAGLYEQARLILEAPAQTPRECQGQDPMAGSHVVDANGPVPIFVPSGANAGVRLVSPFRVPLNGNAEIVVDFDLRQALHKPPAFDCYFLRPTFRVEAVQNSGAIAGVVDSLLLNGSNGMCSDEDPTTGNAVYVYEGSGRTPGDLDSDDSPDAQTTADPFATGRVAFDPSAGNTGQGDFRVAFLPPGDYTVAFTCSADLDELPNPDAEQAADRIADDDLMFQQAQDVAVEAQAASTVEFLSGP